MALVAGSILVPKPAAGMTAFANSLTIVHSKTTFEEMREENFGRKGFCREIGSWDFILCRGLRGFPLHLSDFGFRLGNWEVPNRKGFGVRSYRGGIDHENEYAGICTLGAGLRCGRHLIGYWDDSGVARTTVAQALD